MSPLSALRRMLGLYPPRPVQAQSSASVIRAVTSAVEKRQRKAAKRLADRDRSARQSP